MGGRRRNCRETVLGGQDYYYTFFLFHIAELIVMRFGATDNFYLIKLDTFLNLFQLCGNQHVYFTFFLTYSSAFGKNILYDLHQIVIILSSCIC